MPDLRLTLMTSLAALLVAAPAAAADCPAADVLPTAANVTEVRAAVVCLTNAQRTAAGLPGLVAERRLEASAQAYSARMVTERFFDHVGPDGSTLAGRLVGYPQWLAIGENLAWGEATLATPRATVAAWMRSPGHRANVLSPAFAELGVGVVPGTPTGSSRPAATYTAHYGSRDDAGPSPARALDRIAVNVSRSATRRPASRCKRGWVRSTRGAKRCVRR